MKSRSFASAQSGCLPSIVFGVLALFAAGLVLEFADVDGAGGSLLTLVVMVVVGVLGAVVRTARTEATLSAMPWAEDLLLSDTRQPVLYLRSFAVDTDTHDESSTTSAMRWMNPYGLLTYAIVGQPSFEQALTFQLSQVGPFIALGAPALGAARFREVRGSWQEHVQKYLDQSRLIVVRVGDTAGLKWELAELHRRGLVDRLIVYLQFGGAQDRPLIEARYRAFREWFTSIVALTLPRELGRNRFMYCRNGAGILTRTLPKAMEGVGLRVERSVFRGMAKGVLPGAQNSAREPLRFVAALPPAARWLLFVASAAIGVSLWIVAGAIVAHALPFRSGTVLLVLALALGMSSGVLVGTLSVLCDAAGGAAHVLLGAGLGVWSFWLFNVMWLGTIHPGPLMELLEVAFGWTLLASICFSLIPFGTVIYGLSPAERQRRDAARPEAAGGA